MDRRKFFQLGAATAVVAMVPLSGLVPILPAGSERLAFKLFYGDELVYTKIVPAIKRREGRDEVYDAEDVFIANRPLEFDSIGVTAIDHPFAKEVTSIVSRTYVKNGIGDTVTIQLPQNGVLRFSRS